MKPLLIFSDSPSGSSGLARITRDLATRISSNLGQEFRVATVGYGAAGSRALPFPQYSWVFNDEFVVHDLPEIWHDFAGDEPGVLLTIQDASRMLWLSHPEFCPNRIVAEWLKTAPLEKWGYFPIDATGPRGALSSVQARCLFGYDRILTYTGWAANIVKHTLDTSEVESIPHGIDTDVFYPRDREQARSRFGKITVGREDLRIEADDLLIGIVATNQNRKDFGLAAQAIADVARTRKVKVWIHTDHISRYWDLPMLFRDCGVPIGVFLTLSQFSDDTMAELYSACDVTLAIGLGEGFGYPIFESLACGTPVVHGNYGGAAEFLPKRMLIEPVAYRMEGIHASVRPVFNPAQWAAAIRNASRKDVKLPERLLWKNLWNEWKTWFKKGVSDGATDFDGGGSSGERSVSVSAAAGD